MGTAVAARKSGGAVASRQSYRQALYGLNDGQGDFEGKSILRLKEGEWIFGENETVLEAEDALAVNPDSFRAGWICFNDSNEVAETEEGVKADFLWPIDNVMDEDEIYDQHPLPEVKGKRAKQLEYQYQIAVDMVVVSGPNKGEELVYKITSVGGKRMLAKLAGEIARRDDDERDDVVPIIELYAKDYFNKTWKRDVWNPMANVLDWVERGVSEWEDEGDENEPKTHPRPGEKTKRGEPIDKRRKSRKADEEEKPARGKRGRKRAEPEPEPEDYDEAEDEGEEAEDEAPRGRSRRGGKSGGAERKPAGRGRGRARSEPEPDDADDEGEEDEDEAPRRSNRRRNEGADEPRSNRRDGPVRRRKSDDDDTGEADEDDAPRGRRARAGARSSSRRR